MSNRFKKIKKSRMSKKPADENIVQVKTRAGLFVGSPAGEQGWLKLMSYQLKPGFPQHLAMQQSGCPVSGEVFVKPIEGRYADRPQAENEQRLAELQAFVRSQGGMIGGDDSLPLWARLEFLENTLDFEMEPPCGCPGLLQKR
jgi:hypothetical protein